MRIQIYDDYEKDDMEKFKIEYENTRDAEMEESDVNIIDAVFEDIKIDDEYDGCYKEYYKEYNLNESNEENNNIDGTIIVTSMLANKNKTLISSAKINLYILNGVSPKLITTKYTDSNGKVVFKNLKKGSYRIIAIVDRKYFEKPTYTPWNEVTIDSNTIETSILVTNKIKSI